MLIKTIKNNDKAIIVVDCDCDGYTSAAALLNYLHSLFPFFVENNIKYIMHEDKQHGLNDCIDSIV
jgi:single-stranded DNA-specific DHH superfamily exonuclease